MQASLAKSVNDTLFVEKMQAYLQWTQQDPRVKGWMPFHFYNRLWAPTPDSGSWGAEVLPATLEFIEAHKPPPLKTEDTEAAAVSAAALALAGGGASHDSPREQKSGSSSSRRIVSGLLQSQGLGHVEQKLRAEGLVSVCDFGLLSDKDFQAVGVSQLLPRRRLQQAANELCDQQRGKNQESPPPPPLPATGIKGIKTFSCIENGPTGMPYIVGTNTTETTICEHNATAAGAITHMQFTYTDLVTAFTGARFRAYIDGEASPSIDVASIFLNTDLRPIVLMPWRPRFCKVLDCLGFTISNNIMFCDYL
jgi:hypothetical protein